MSYVLLTGATGLVGRYLLRDLLDEQLSVAVVARSSRAATANARIEAIMARWESLAGRSLRRPVVLAGDLRQPQLGLSAADRDWIRRRCDRVLHSAASMTFREDKQGEPFRTNVDGMKNLLALCQELSIREFHHVSTAYICGLRSGRIFEDDVDLGQQNGNVYEVSKLAAEKMLRAADFLEAKTIYRPASVVGDSRTGYTTSSHGFYLPLQLAYLIADKVPPELMGERFLKLLGLGGDEGKNLVPVDWLSAAITRLFTTSSHHGRTFHLTNPRPVTVRLIQQVVREAIERHCPNRFSGTPTEEELVAYETQFKDYMEIYRSHWRDDPVFDCANTLRSLPDLPCPVMGHDCMFRVASYPIERKFILHEHDLASDRNSTKSTAAQRLMALASAPDGRSHSASPNVARSSREDRTGDSRICIGLEVSGPGGGQWSVIIDRDHVVGIERGASAEDQLQYYMSGKTFALLADGGVTVEQGIEGGRVVVERRCSASADEIRPLRRVFEWAALARQREPATIAAPA